jgi:hypothetical protein
MRAEIAVSLDRGRRGIQEVLIGQTGLACFALCSLQGSRPGGGAKRSSERELLMMIRSDPRRLRHVQDDYVGGRGPRDVFDYICDLRKRIRRHERNLKESSNWP